MFYMKSIEKMLEKFVDNGRSGNYVSNCEIKWDDNRLDTDKSWGDYTRFVFDRLTLTSAVEELLRSPHKSVVITGQIETGEVRR